MKKKWEDMFMDMKIANSWWMYMLGVIVVVFILSGCIFFILRAFKDAKKKGMDQKKLKQLILYLNELCDIAEDEINKRIK